MNHRQRKPGFALVVTLSLMILLTVIAVGLLTLSSVSLRQSSSSLAAAEARQNARLALMLAIGQLQRHAGPDQRITATANIAGKDTGDPLSPGESPQNANSVAGVGKGLTPVHPGTRHWTGVWKNESQAPRKDIFTRTPSPLLEHWLVSGNDARDPANLLLPGDATYAVSASGAVTDPTQAVLLVGQGSAGGTAANPSDRYVVAPAVGIRRGSTTALSGRYAWWVGDEGVKARINTQQVHADGTQYVALPAQRRGWEAVDGLANYPLPASPGHDSLAKVISLRQAEILMPDAINDLRAVFHSATAESLTVIADPLAGGTKVDLTTILNNDLPATRPANAANIPNYPVRNGKIIDATDNSYPGNFLRAPVWSTVKAFHDQHGALNSGNLVVRAPTNNLSPAIAPIVTDFRLLLGAKIVPVGPPASATQFRVNPCAKVAIAIANPYSVPLRWNQNLEFRVINQTPPGNHPSRIWPLGSQNGPAFIPRDSSEPAVFQNSLLRIQPGTLEPGEARAYTIPGPVVHNGSGFTVNLAPFASSQPFNFENSIEMRRPDANNPPHTPVIVMDIRESMQTSLVKLEVKLQGSSRALRSIERFELDNGYYQPTTRRLDLTQCRLTRLPIPLMLYSYQLSQPGSDYLNLMPAGYEMGQRASTMRTFADFNVAAAVITKPIASYNPPPYFCESNDSIGQLPTTPPGGITGPAFTRNLVADPLPWGRAPNGSRKTILFTIPEQLTSLAQLQHADLTGDTGAAPYSTQFASVSHQPGNAFGNSYATPFVKRQNTIQTRTDYELTGANLTSVKNLSRRYFDLSYLLNASVWDTYFLSTIPKSGARPQPQIPAIMSLAGAEATDLRDPLLAATKLMIHGGFNINSTDKNAWKAFLASAKHFKHKADSGNPSTAAFPRSLEQASPSADPPSGTSDDSFAGFRRLTDPQLDALAEEITRQVRLRGPFLSVSHFVNRALTPLDSHPALGRAGALQVALDESGANINFVGNKSPFSGFSASNDAVTLRQKNGRPRADMDGMNAGNDRPPDADPSEPDWAATSRDRNYGTVASIIADRKMLESGSMQEQGYRSTGIPGWLTQADVLQVIGPSITARSDTFRIRAYGESLDAQGRTTAKAYCEAVVQRYPDYVDPTNPPHLRGTELSPINRTYGRKFEIISFRWLSPLEV